ncbi:hypothetical protein GA0070216_10720 [Micromonospora matsumotoense]|uniref:Uncharacterized protein n=1 Tax=Micromonospora matsumotoense TaxID=121616 RepID=A0A1C4YP26_9ACTN|nr:hypothetical protein GA0070216_10720 [Micromonospora matsumotoense]
MGSNRRTVPTSGVNLAPRDVGGVGGGAATTPRPSRPARSSAGSTICVRRSSSAPNSARTAVRCRRSVVRFRRLPGVGRPRRRPARGGRSLRASVSRFRVPTGRHRPASVHRSRIPGRSRHRRASGRSRHRRVPDRSPVPRRVPWPVHRVRAGRRRHPAAPARRSQAVHRTCRQPGPAGPGRRLPGPSRPDPVALTGHHRGRRTPVGRPPRRSVGRPGPDPPGSVPAWAKGPGPGRVRRPPTAPARSGPRRHPAPTPPPVVPAPAGPRSRSPAGRRSPARGPAGRRSRPVRRHLSGGPVPVPRHPPGRRTVPRHPPGRRTVPRHPPGHPWVAERYPTTGRAWRQRAVRPCGGVGPCPTTGRETDGPVRSNPRTGPARVPVPVVPRPLRRTRPVRPASGWGPRPVPECCRTRRSAGRVPARWHRRAATPRPTRRLPGPGLRGVAVPRHHPPPSAIPVTGRPPSGQAAVAPPIRTGRWCR